MTHIRPTLDPREVEAVIRAPEVEQWLGKGEAESYLQPGTVFLVVEQKGVIVGGHALDYIADGVALAHNLLMKSATDKLGILRRSMLWAFGPGGINRIVGKTETTNKPAVAFAVRFGAMQRLHDDGENIWTAVSFQDWIWRHEKWFAEAVEGLEDGMAAVPLGCLVRMIRIGAAGRGVALYNEWAAAAGWMPAQVLRATTDAAMVQLGDAQAMVLPDRIEVMT